jgi:large subunit ribosomal protein L9
MKVKLLQDIPRLGSKNQILEVSDTYAINVLLKTNKAVRATDALIKAKEAEEKAKREAKEKEGDAFIALYEALKKEPLTFKKKTDPKGHLYAKLSSAEFADEIFNEYNISIDPKIVHISDHDRPGELEVTLEHKGKKYSLKAIIK